ncbi:hypothetical protein MICRO11B_280021 [Micrococcus luteus]|nr:hypothetical protein MICRO11B_280021 [Micrococcus luteus]
MERHHGGHAVDAQLGQGVAGAGDGLGAVLAPHDELGEQGVVLARHHGAGADARVHADPGAGGGLERVDRAGHGQEAVRRVLSVEAELEGVAARRRVLGDAQRLAGGDAELLAHQVHAEDLLGDRMLHLQAGVHLQEADEAVRGHEVLDRAGPGVPGGAADLAGGGVDALALLVREERRRGLLHELLVAALQGAVAGAEHGHVAVLVGEDLGLHVAGAVQEALHEALAAAERGDGLADGRLERVLDVAELAHHADAAAAAAEGRLDGDRQAVLLGERARGGGVRHGAVRTRHERGARLLGEGAGGDLVAEGADGVRRRADPGHPGVDHGLREVGVLGEEAVARVHGVGAGAAGDVEDRVDLQVGVRRGRARQVEGLVRDGHVQGVGVRIRVDGDRGDAVVAGGAGHAHGDLAAVGDEHPRDGAGGGGGGLSLPRPGRVRRPCPSPRGPFRPPPAAAHGTERVPRGLAAAQPRDGRRGGDPGRGPGPAGLRQPDTAADGGRGRRAGGGAAAVPARELGVPARAQPVGPRAGIRADRHALRPGGAHAGRCGHPADAHPGDRLPGRRAHGPGPDGGPSPRPHGHPGAVARRAGLSTPDNEKDDGRMAIVLLGTASGARIPSGMYPGS